MDLNIKEQLERERKHRIYNLQIAIFKLVIVIIFSCIIEFMNTRISQNYSESIKNIFTFFGGAYLMANIMQSPINGFKNAITDFLPKELTQDKESEKILFLSKECSNRFKRLKPAISENNLIKLEDYINQLELERNIEYKKT
jgi:hypothetical protein